MKSLKRTDLVVGKCYWIKRKKNKGFWEFNRPLLFVGYPFGGKKPVFTFGPDVDSYSNNFNFVPNSTEYNFYNEEV